MNCSDSDMLVYSLFRCCSKKHIDNKEYKFRYLLEIMFNMGILDNHQNLNNQLLFRNRRINLSIPRYNQDYQEIKKLGSGGFGDVYLSQYYLDNRKYAIKKIEFENDSLHELQKIISEIEIISKLNHPNIVRYYYSWIEPLVIPSTKKRMIKAGCKTTKIIKFAK